MKLNRYNASTGELDKTLFEEKHPKYVEPQTPVRFVPGQNDRFIWMSRRDGYNHIYLYNTEGNRIKQLTSGPWEVTGVEGFDKNGQHLFFTSTKESPLERHLYRVNMNSGNITRLTSQPGYHSTRISADGQYIIDRYNNRETPNTIRMINRKGKVIRTLLESPDPLKEYNLGEVTISTIKAADGETDLYYRMIKPANFDPDKQYPAIVYVYGGPHAQLIHNRWLGGARMWQHYMAQKGYVMLTVDNRGSANRGLEFENVIHRNLGKHEMADQMQGIKLLKSLDYVDPERIGVHGWSYGGFMTTSLMLKKPDQFKVGVAGGPVIDWKYYEVMYGERYMDTPQDNPEGYKQANLKNYVGNLKGDLLLIHGYIDDVVVMQHSLSFIRKAVSEGVQLDYFVYPRHEHNVGGKDRLHLMRKITNYFEENL
jgi:dipeptidyl-peptidase-4